MSQVYSISNIYQLIQQLKNNGSKTVVLKCYMPWCGHCKNIAEPYRRLSERYNDVVFLEINMENDNDGIGSKFGVSGYPTFLIFKNETVKSRVVGADLDRLELNINSV
jgi:thiol-disulfide isomerase/thioredoxin